MKVFLFVTALQTTRARVGTRLKGLVIARSALRALKLLVYRYEHLNPLTSQSLSAVPDLDQRLPSDNVRAHALLASADKIEFSTNPLGPPAPSPVDDLTIH
jgi:hypothetical protein